MKPEMENELFYDLRHLKDFRKIVGKNKYDVWQVRWPDGGEVEIQRAGDVVCTIPNHDIQLATYICSLHNMSTRMIKEVESKYE